MMISVGCVREEWWPCCNVPDRIV